MGRSITIQGDDVRRLSFLPDCFPEECLCCDYIAGSAQPTVDGLPGFVHCSIKVDPLAAHLDIGLVDSPRAPAGSSKPLPALDKLRGISLNPAQDRGVGKTRSRKLSL